MTDTKLAEIQRPSARHLEAAGVLSVLEAVAGRWLRTQDIAASLGYDHRPGHSLAMLRGTLYWLHVNDYIEHQPQRNGHLWRSPTQEAQE